MIAAKQATGWTFAILSAGLDAYGEGGRFGHDPGSTQAFAGTGAGARPLGPAHPMPCAVSAATFVPVERSTPKPLRRRQKS